MTTIAEFLELTQPQPYIQKEAWSIPRLNWSMPEINRDTVQKGVDYVLDNVPYAKETAQWVMQNPYADKAVRGVTGENYNVKSMQREGGNRYYTMAQRLLGGDDKSNGYLEYFRNKSQSNGYSDQQFVYDLSEIMKSNPKVADVMMYNAMKGDTTYADMLYGMGQAYKESDPKQAAQFFRNARQMYGLKGKLGKTFMGPSMLGGFLYSGHTKGVDAMLEAQKNSPSAQMVMDSYKNKATNADFGQYAENYNNNVYKPNVEDQYYAHNFYGALNNPASQGALQYGAPWMAYGIPIAGALSMMGNHGAWPLVLGGGALSMMYGGALGGGYMSEFAKSPMGQTIGNFVSMANGPAATAMGGFRGTAPMGKTLTAPPSQFGNTNPTNNNSNTTNNSTGEFGTGPTTAPTNTTPETYTQNGYDYYPY